MAHLFILQFEFKKGVCVWVSEGKKKLSGWFFIHKQPSFEKKKSYRQKQETTNMISQGHSKISGWLQLYCYTSRQKREEESGFWEVGLLGNGWHLARHFLSRRRGQRLQEWPADSITIHRFPQYSDKMQLLFSSTSSVLGWSLSQRFMETETKCLLVFSFMCGMR